MRKLTLMSVVAATLFATILSSTSLIADKSSFSVPIVLTPFNVKYSLQVSLVRTSDLL